jgi:hemolysin-activating ACP:hemolysin acyltransferase
MLDERIATIQLRLEELNNLRTLRAAKDAVASIVSLLIPEVNANAFRLFQDSDGKLVANSGWFQFDEEIVDRRATYTLDLPANSNLDVKVFGVNGKSTMRIVSWAVGITPNFEDEPFNGRFNVGIDFIIPESRDRLIVALSKNYVIRTMELHGALTTTYQEILSAWSTIIATDNKTEFHQTLWNSVDLHPINKKFYQGISERFSLLCQHLEAHDIFDSHLAPHFANRLIGRVIFAWFLLKKGLLDESSGYFEPESFDDDSEYYRKRLETLFFEVLNTPISERIADDRTTPYLNGGLFEPKPEDLQGNEVLTFPVNYFDDFIHFLRGYNFTTDESTSEFQQVAIDPEMLGRIFENLLAEISEETGAQARKAKGAFYTPREIVDYMCRESLKSYLRSKIESDEKLERRLYQLIDAPDREFQDQDHNWRRDFKPYKDEIIGFLDNLRVIDPACGSGAFPIGMMQLLVKVYSRLESRFDPQKAKLGIIERNIFGVDIEPMAIEISKLRTWLALVVDEESSSGAVKPLPNLDFKFVCANSLLNLEESGDAYLFEDEALDRKLQDIREAYFRTQSLAMKTDLRAKYQKLVQEEFTLFGDSPRTAQLKSFQPFESDVVASFFDPAQMFGVEEFDIVIANPPYIGEKSNKGIFRVVRNSKLGRQFAQSKMDYFYYFFHLAIQLGSGDCVITVITTNYFPTATSAYLLRKEFKENLNVLKLINFNELKIFKSAAGQHNMISLLQKGEPTSEYLARTCVTGRKGDADATTLSRILNWEDPETEYFEIRQDELYRGERLDIALKGNRKIDGLLGKIASSGKPLKSEMQITKGLETGANKIFVFSEIPEILKLDPDCLEKFVKPLFKNSDILRFGCKAPSKKVLYLPNGLVLEDHPNIAAYLEPHIEMLSSRAQVVRSNKPWHELLWPRNPEVFMARPKILAPYRSRRNEFFFTENSFYGSTDTYFITTDKADVNLKVISAFLNSSLGLVWFKNLGKNKGSMLDLTGDNLELFPLPPAPVAGGEDSKIVALVDALSQLVDARENRGEVVDELDFAEKYRHLDRLVLEQYGLTGEEIELISSEASNIEAGLIAQR